ncbi:MAG: dTDP-glucose 4,6-dehydratase, partial [Actinomycetota bacterium]|nr:dTDP-glucose 4,6-dehydratase [Actinomycetota bacterium]
GGCGFIGSAVVRHLIQETEHEVINVDLMTYAATEGSVMSVANNERYRHLALDIRDPEAIDTAFLDHQPEAVMHLAAESHVDRSIEDPDAFVHTNVFGTNVLCDVARRSDIERFVHISTDETYGSIDFGSFQELDRLEPRSPYSAAKAGSDLIALSYVTTYGLPVVVTRCSNNYGPYQFPEKLIPLFTTNLLDGLKVPLYGDGGNIRDWIHVEDHNRAVQVVLEKGEIGGVYNIGANNEITNREIAYRLLDLCGRDESFIEPVADRLGHDRRYSVDIDRISALGWKLTRDFETGLAETVDWYKSRRDWWEPLKARTSR